MTAVDDRTAITREVAFNLEADFLGGLEDAQFAYERIVETEAWKLLDFESFADWWAQRVQPTMRALSMRPTKEIAASVIEKVREEEAELPAAQRRTQRELAEMVGVGKDTVGRLVGSRSTPDANAHRTDLGEPEPVHSEEEPPLPGMPAAQEFADQLTDAIETQLREQLDAARSRQEFRDDLKAIPAEHIEALSEAARPAIQFGRLVDACRSFLESLASVDFDYAAQGLSAEKAAPIREVLDRLARIRQLLEAHP